MGILYRPRCKTNEHYKFPQRFDVLLKVNGCWPTDGDILNSGFRCNDRMYTIWFWFVLFNLTFIVGSELRYFLANISDVTKAVENLCTFMIGAFAVFRMIHMRYAMHSFKDILTIFSQKIWFNK